MNSKIARAPQDRTNEHPSDIGSKGFITLIVSVYLYQEFVFAANCCLQPFESTIL